MKDKNNFQERCSPNRKNSIPKIKKENKSETILEKIEKKLASEWPKRICHPRSHYFLMNGMLKTYWLPAEEREPEDFENFYSGKP